MNSERPICHEAKPESEPQVRSGAWLWRVVCKWKGHDDHNTYEAWWCSRCGRIMDYDEAVKPTWRERLHDWLKAKKNWWHCRECGGRFGKHDDSDHIPF